MTSAVRSEVDGPRVRGETTAGRLGWRPTLPSGRAVTGAFLVAVAVVVAFSAWLGGQGPGGERWVIARHDLGAGARLSPDDLATATMALPRSGEASHAFRDPSQLLGRTLAGPLRAGDLVQDGGLVARGSQPALRPVPVPVGASDLAPLVPGELTVVLVTDGTDAAATTSVVVRGATVLAVSRSSGGLIGSQSAGVVTLGVADLSEVEAIVHAEHTGTLTVVVGEPSDGRGIGGASPSSTGETSTSTTVPG